MNTRWAGRAIAAAGIFALWGGVATEAGNRRADSIKVYVDQRFAGMGVVVDGVAYVPLRTVSDALKIQTQYSSVSKRVDMYRQPLNRPIMTPAPTRATEAAPSDAKLYRLVKLFSSDAITQTIPIQSEPFAITSKRWRIKWVLEPRELSTTFLRVNVYRAKGSRLVLQAANAVQAGSNTVYLNEPGEFYLEITATSKYSVTVEQE